MNNNRDCEHGSQVGKCYICDLVESENRIAEIEAGISEFKNPKNWTRSYNCYGNLINSHALFLPRIKEDK